MLYKYCEGCKHNNSMKMCGISVNTPCSYDGKSPPTRWEAAASMFTAGNVLEYRGRAQPSWHGLQLEVTGPSPGGTFLGTILSTPDACRGVNYLAPGNIWRGYANEADYVLVSAAASAQRIIGTWIPEASGPPECNCRGGGYFGHEEGCKHVGYYSSKLSAPFK